MSHNSSNQPPPTRASLKQAHPPRRKAKPARQKGLEIEQLAARLFCQQGYQILQQNYHCRHGEIDLILEQQELLVFVEVKFRKNNLEQALEAVTWRKQQRLIAAAKHFLLSYPDYHSHNCRFDVLGVSQNQQHFIYRWLKDAFCLETG